ncbi:MAG: hypothetical protein HGA45_25175 [Chloroflexales bacterium]|nr:hypothetical protein [Chloroflexales bacterium]
MTASPRAATSAQGRWSYLWLLIGAGLLVFANGRWMIPLATWLAPVFLIRFARTQPAVRGLGLLLVANVAVYLFSWQGMVPGGLYLPVMGGYAVVFWLPYLADRLLVNRLQGFAATLVFPLLYVTLEYINALTNPFGSWLSLAYTQHSFLPFLQLLSITGMWGLTFLVTWLAPVVNWAWAQDFAWQRVRAGVLTYGGILTLVLLYGGGRMALFPPQSKTLQVASLTQTAEEGRFLEYGDRMLEQSRQQAQAGAEVIIWQEGAVQVLREDEASFIEKARALAQEEAVHLLLGLYTVPEGYPDVKAANQAVWITPDGDVKWRYLKGRPVPGDPDVAGDGVIPRDQTVFGALASVICFDMDFPAYLRQAGQAGTDVMLVPSNDSPAIDPLHTHMASFRGIENGFSIVRATGHGLSAAFDYQGRILAAADFFTTKHAMVAHVPTHGVKTIYSVIGDLVAWLSMVGFATLVGLALFRSAGGAGARK